jgi:hypothetical protein
MTVGPLNLAAGENALELEAAHETLVYRMELSEATE